jgi:hypothetical protein
MFFKFYSASDFIYDIIYRFPDCGRPSVINAAVSLYNSTDAIANCFSSYKPDVISLHCLVNGTWAADTKCSLPEGISFLNKRRY